MAPTTARKWLIWQPEGDTEIQQRINNSQKPTKLNFDNLKFLEGEFTPE